jgi:hypothetical protein
MAALVETGAQTAMTGIPVPVLMAAREVAKMKRKKEKKSKINEALNALPTVQPGNAP